MLVYVKYDAMKVAPIEVDAMGGDEMKNVDAMKMTDNMKMTDVTKFRVL